MAKDDLPGSITSFISTEKSDTLLGTTYCWQRIGIATTCDWLNWGPLRRAPVVVALGSFSSFFGLKKLKLRILRKSQSLQEQLSISAQLNCHAFRLRLEPLQTGARHVTAACFLLPPQRSTLLGNSNSHTGIETRESLASPKALGITQGRSTTLPPANPMTWFIAKNDPSVSIETPHCPKQQL